MYLSRVEIDEENHRKMRDLTHLGAYHNWVEQSFPIEVARGIRKRHLWRIDQLNGRRYLLVLSEDKPDLTKLGAYGISATIQTKDYSPFLSRIQAGQRMHFRLVANPVRRHGSSSNNKERTLPQITVDQQCEWLMKRAAHAGFKINEDSFDVTERKYAPLYKNRRKLRLSQVAFEGILEVVDVDAFRHALTHGIGHEKAYGMGMLTAIPIN